MCCIGRPGDAGISIAPSNATTGAENFLHLLDNYGCSTKAQSSSSTHTHDASCSPTASTPASSVDPVRLSQAKDDGLGRSKYCDQSALEKNFAPSSCAETNSCASSSARLRDIASLLYARSLERIAASMSCAFAAVTSRRTSGFEWRPKAKRTGPTLSAPHTRMQLQRTAPASRSKGISRCHIFFEL